jgi:hypothetical protein
VWKKLFCLGKYEDIHVAMLVSNMFRVMMGKSETVRRIRYVDWGLERTQIEATATGFVHAELGAKWVELNALQQATCRVPGSCIILCVPGPALMALCAGEVEGEEERPAVIPAAVLVEAVPPEQHAPPDAQQEEQQQEQQQEQ